jgi:hypothetical protein
MMDNASNNDMMIDAIVELAKRHIRYDPQWIRLHCMPHTVHLAALKVYFKQTSHSVYA